MEFVQWRIPRPQLPPNDAERLPSQRYGKCPLVLKQMRDLEGPSVPNQYEGPNVANPNEDPAAPHQEEVPAVANQGEDPAVAN